MQVLDCQSATSGNSGVESFVVTRIKNPAYGILEWEVGAARGRDGGR